MRKLKYFLNFNLTQKFAKVSFLNEKIKIFPKFYFKKVFINIVETKWEYLEFTPYKAHI